MSINNSNDLNNYYKIINELVDNYVEKHKIRPTNLINYLTPGSDRFNKFLTKNGLSEVRGSDRILADILLDRAGMEEDGIYTFESYKFFESVDFKISNLKQCLYKGIEKTDIKSEKVIADYFDINLGDIDVIDSEKHLFKINDWNNDDWEVIIYSEEDISIISSNIKEYLLDELKKSKIELAGDIIINLDDLIEDDYYSKKIEKELTEDKLKSIITNLLGNEAKFTEKLGSHYLWVR